MSEKKSVLKDKMFLFALRILKLCKFHCDEKREFVLSKQLLRSGSSVGANIREAQNAQSQAEFIHKLSISQKVCDEANYWIKLLFHSDYLTENKYQSVKNYAEEILKMLKSSILTTKKRNSYPNTHNS